MEVLKFTDLQQQTLFALGRFKFLTAFQISRIVDYIPNSVNRSIKSLPDGLVDYHDFGVISGIGKIPRLYFLKPKGADLLEEMGAEHIRFPKARVILAPHSYAHRVGLVDIQIAFELFLERKEMDLNFFEVDFDVVGRNRGNGVNRTQLTKIYISDDEEDFIIPDLVFSYENHEGQTPFYLGEFHRGKDAGRFMRQLWQYVRALQAGSPTEKYKDRVGERRPRILCVFELQSTRNAVARRVLQEDRFAELRSGLLFATIEDVKKDFETAFKTLENEQFRF